MQINLDVRCLSKVSPQTVCSINKFLLTVQSQVYWKNKIIASKNTFGNKGPIYSGCWYVSLSAKKVKLSFRTINKHFTFLAKCTLNSPITISHSFSRAHTNSQNEN